MIREMNRETDDGEEVVEVNERRRGRPRNPANDNPNLLSDEIAMLYNQNGEFGAISASVCRKDPKTGKNPQVCQLHNLTVDTLPTPDGIGKEYGAGEYTILVNYYDEEKNKKLKTYKFDLGKEYNQYVQNQPEAAKSDSAAFGALVELVKNNPQNGSGNMEMFMKMSADNNQTLLLLFQQMQQQAQNAAAAQAQQMQATMQLMMAQMTSQAQNTQAMFTAMLGGKQNETFGEKMLVSLMPKLLDRKDPDTFGLIEKVMDLKDRFGGDGKEEPEKKMADKIVDAVITYVPMMIKSSIDAFTVRSIISKYPEFQALQENPQLRDLVAEKLQDKVAAGELAQEDLAKAQQFTGVNLIDSAKAEGVEVI
jgi:hypothetical protein